MWCFRVYWIDFGQSTIETVQTIATFPYPFVCKVPQLTQIWSKLHQNSSACFHHFPSFVVLAPVFDVRRLPMECQPIVLIQGNGKLLS